MDGKLLLNIVHRPELAPEYAEMLNSHGKKENIADKNLLDESLEIFRLQQRIAHENGLKTTIQMTYASLFNEEAVKMAKENARKYGDEIGLSLLGLPCKEFRDKYKTKDFCIWMFSREDKKSIVDDVFTLFYQKFGFYPSSTGSYYMDAYLINYIKSRYPSVKAAIATCWEEGPKAYRTCNNSWYTFLDGGPWNPWIPSKINTHIPAKDEEEDSGIVAIPHLSRDLLACFDGNGSNFGTHPQNILRGMIYRDGKYPYLFNLIDRYRALAKYNNGYCYNMIFVGPGWMNKAGRWEVSYELSEQSYKDCMAYYGKLKKENKLIDLTMTEFAKVYREEKAYDEAECALWKDMLYGSDKQLFWYIDPYLRTCLDMNQGGAMIDLRPYAARLEIPVGIGTKNVQDASYPFLVQSMYRAGYFTHYAGEGTIKSLKVSYNGKETDTCLCRTQAKMERDGERVVLTLDPVEVVLDGLRARIGTVLTFEKGSSSVKTERTVLSLSDQNAKIELNEYITSCYGTTEYPQDMTGIKLFVTNKEEEKTIEYEYKCRYISAEGAQKAWAVIPQINTRLTLAAEGGGAEGYAREGYAFSPMFTLGYKARLGLKEVLTTWLKLEKEN